MDAKAVLNGNVVLEGGYGWNHSTTCRNRWVCSLRRNCNKQGWVMLTLYAEWQRPLAMHRDWVCTFVKAVRENKPSIQPPLHSILGGNGSEGPAATDGSELQSTLRLVESAMLAATVGLAYFLSNLLRIENYFGCFFPLPPVISSLRWGAAAGRKTMVATVMLLLVLSGPLKAASYLLMHGLLGLTMGTLWSWGFNWGLSIVICTVIRALGALGFVLLTSWLLRENLLSLITINTHASISYILAVVGINIIPSMRTIYLIFAILLFINCGSFVFLLHVLYAIFFRRLGVKSLSFPGWLNAI